MPTCCFWLTTACLLLASACGDNPDTKRTAPGNEGPQMRAPEADGGLLEIPDATSPGDDKAKEIAACILPTEPFFRMPAPSAAPKDVCTEEQVQAVADCIIEPDECAAWTKLNPECAACVFPPAEAPRGPYFLREGDTRLTPNQEGCMDLRSRTGCGAAVFDSEQCLSRTCDSCEDAFACYDVALAGDCKANEDLVLEACEGINLDRIGQGCLINQRIGETERDMDVFLVRTFCANPHAP